MDTHSVELRTTLYRKHSGGQIGTWQCLVEHGMLRYGHAVVEGGSTSWFQDPIVLNNSGRSFDEQARLEFESRVRRMLQRGYKTTREEAAGAAHGTNQHGHPLPMLAHPIKRVGVKSGLRMWEQPKFDGHRALTVFGGERGVHEMYSRKGTSIRGVGSVEHIMETIDAYVPPDVQLDGELYLHGVPLQTLASWIKQNQANSVRLEYMIYDVIMDAPYSERFEVVKDVVRGLNARNPKINAAYTREIGDVSEAMDAFKGYRVMGYEGAMLRLDGEAYRPGVRSSHLLKIKEREESEFPIVDVVETKVGANLVLLSKTGRRFETLAPGTHVEKARFLTDESLWKGKQATCEYPYLTNDGIPFHCVCTRIREDV